MNPEVNVPIVEQLNPTEKAEAIKRDYAIAPDGTIVKAEELKENPESPQVA
jgi:hypothetical protein